MILPPGLWTRLVPSGVDDQFPAQLVQDDMVMPPAVVLEVGAAGASAVPPVQHEPAWPERHLIGFEHRLKDRDRVKDKVAESLAVKGRTVAEAMRLIPDAIR